MCSLDVRTTNRYLYQYPYFLFIPRFLKDQPIEEGKKFRTEKKSMRGEFALILYIEDCPVEDAGEVRCHAKNPVGEADTKCALTVQG